MQRVQWTLCPVNGRATDGSPRAFERRRDSESEERLGPVPKRRRECAATGLAREAASANAWFNRHMVLYA